MRKHLILAVDDRPELLAAVTEMLEHDFKIIGVKSYVDALEIMEKQRPSLFLLDIEMPVFDGYDIASIIRMDPRFEKTPIIFLTGNASKDSVIKAVNNGADDYIVKPVKRHVLLGKIRKLLPLE